MTLQNDVGRVRLDDGRTLAYAESGDPGGQPVFAFHGLPGSRLQQHPDSGIAAARGIRVIHLDRPGFGRSTPQPGRTLASWATDVAAVADHLRIEHFAVFGVSGGGPFGLACASLLGERITRAAIVSSVGPPGSMREGRMIAFVRIAFFLAVHAPWAMKLPLGVLSSVARASPARAVGLGGSRLTPADTRLLARPDIRAMLGRDIAESFRQGVDATICDLKLEVRPWNLPLAAVRAPVALWHGEADRMIPPSATLALAAAIPNSEVHLLPGEGHFLVFDRWGEILDRLLR